MTTKFDELLNMMVKLDPEEKNYEKWIELVKDVKKQIDDGISYKMWHNILKLDYEKLELKLDFWHNEIEKHTGTKDFSLLISKYLNREKQIEKYKTSIENIEKLTLHAGCQGNPKCHYCPICKEIKRLNKQLENDS